MTVRDKSTAQTSAQPSSRRSRFGFMKGRCKVPEDFDRLCQAEIEEMFYGSIEPPKDDVRASTVVRPRKP